LRKTRHSHEGELMQITSRTKVMELIDRYDFMLDYLVDLSPRFKLLKNPVARKTVGNIATLSQAAIIGGINIDRLAKDISDKIRENTGEIVPVVLDNTTADSIVDLDARQEVLKDIIRDLHAGADIEDMKQRFRELIKDIDASEILKMEQSLIQEGMPDDEVKRLCDVHVQVFRESLEAKDTPPVPEGHPVHTFMLENRAAENIMNKLESVCNLIDGNGPDEFGKYSGNLVKLLSSLRKIDIHFLRKENQLFPHLEKIGISGPTQVMWALDDDIRSMLKKSEKELNDKDLSSFSVSIKEAIQTIRDMIYKEEHILFPVAVGKFSEAAWNEIRKGENEIGYAWIKPVDPPSKSDTALLPAQNDGQVKLDTGALSIEQINLVLKHLPVDISFVDVDDTVKYYSATEERIFPRSPAVIGRKIRNCHPPKSVYMVKQILDDFRSGKRDTAEFWIQLHGRFIHIRYFAVRDGSGEYKGCLEVSQDVTGIRSLEGEKRLLDQPSSEVPGEGSE